MELKLGIMNNKELAEWFGVSEQTIKNTKKKRLDMLKEYAEFTEEKGKVNITKIIKPEYQKSISKVDLVRNNFDEYWNENRIDTCTHAAAPLSESLKVSEETAAAYVRKARDYYYGSPVIKKQREGIKGCCRFIWTRVVDDDKLHFEPVSGEELKIIKELYNDIMGDVVSRDIIIKEAIANKKLTKDELWKIYEDDIKEDQQGRYLVFLRRVKQKLGFNIAKATILLDRGQDAIKVEDGTTILTIDSEGNMKVEEKNLMLPFD